MSTKSRSAPNWDLIFPYEPVQLSDAQWADITKYSGLPNAARPILGKAIAGYRDYKASTVSSLSAKDTRIQLDRLHGQATLLGRGIEGALRNAEANFALTVLATKQGGALGERQRVEQKLNALKGDLDNFAKQLALARSKVRPMKRGQSRRAEPVRLFVWHLELILENFKDKKLDRSKAVRAICIFCLQGGGPRCRSWNYRRGNKAALNGPCWN